MPHPTRALLTQNHTYFFSRAEGSYFLYFFSFPPLSPPFFPLSAIYGKVAEPPLFLPFLLPPPSSPQPSQLTIFLEKFRRHPLAHPINFRPGYNGGERVVLLVLT